MLNESNADCLPIFKWLISQWDNNGKFNTINDQDMIIGIQALSEFSRKFSIKDTDLVNITIDATNNTKYAFNVNKDTAIILQSQKV